MLKNIDPMAIDVFILLITFSFLPLAAILIHSIVLKKGWTFPRLAKLNRFAKYVILYMFIFFIASAIIGPITFFVQEFTNSKILGILELVSSVLLTIIMGKRFLRYYRTGE